jgi:hypothetical protein
MVAALSLLQVGIRVACSIQLAYHVDFLSEARAEFWQSVADGDYDRAFDGLGLYRTPMHLRQIFEFVAKRTNTRKGFHDFVADEFVMKLAVKKIAELGSQEASDIKVLPVALHSFLQQIVGKVCVKDSFFSDTIQLHVRSACCLTSSLVHQGTSDEPRLSICIIAWLNVGLILEFCWCWLFTLRPIADSVVSNSSVDV